MDEWKVDPFWNEQLSSKLLKYWNDYIIAASEAIEQSQTNLPILSRLDLVKTELKMSLKKWSTVE